MDKKTPVLNKVKNRLLILSPSVKSGKERECNKNDFIQEGGRPIGKGGFAEVWKVTQKQTKKVFVIKVMNKRSIIEQKLVDQINREIEILYRVNHPHIVKLVNHFEDEDSFYLIMNYASKGQLYSLLKRHNRLDEKTAAQYILEVITAVEYLHNLDPPIIHRDIKPENILLDENYRVKLADFGWSNYVSSDEVRKTYCGTPEYLSPEMIRRQGHDTSIDVWSIGILLFELLTGHSPFRGTNQEELFNNVKKNRIIWTVDFPPLAKDLISMLLKANPQDRISLANIKKHKWFKSIPDLKLPIQIKETDKRTLLETHLIFPMKDAEESKGEEESVKTINTISKSKFENNISKSYNDSFETLIIEEMDVIKKELNHVKHKLDKSEAEVKKYIDKIQKYKEKENYWNTVEVENSMLNEQIEEYKVLNQNRYDLLAEIEQKDIELIFRSRTINKLESEITNLTNGLKLSDSKLIETRRLIDESENKNNQLKQAMEELIKTQEFKNSSNQEQLENLNKLMEISQQPLSDISKEASDLITGIFKEIKQLVQSKAKNISVNLRSIQQNTEKTDEIFLKLLNDNHSMLVGLVNKVKSSFQEECEKLVRNISQNKTNKTNHKIEELKKQIVELMPYKVKNIQIEAKFEKLEGSVSLLNEKLKTLNDYKSTSEILNSEKDTVIAKLNDKIVDLEAKLSDVKDFLFRNCSDKLDEFTPFYQ